MIARYLPLLCCVVCAAFSAAGSAHAQDGLGAHAKVQRSLAARNEEDATAAATTVEVKRRPMALETLRDVMPEVPGALPIAGGGYGSFSSVSLRGSGLGQTVWLLGDVPLNSPDTGAFDMSLMPVSQIDRIEVYRGGAPLWLSQGSIAGVVRVVPREGEGTGGGAQVGIGSYGLYELRGSGYVVSKGRRDVALYSAIQGTSSEGDFRYLDDRGTRFSGLAEDDVERRIHNAQVRDGSGLFHLRAGLGRGHLDTVFYGIERQGGVPGSGGARNARLTRRGLRRGLLATAYTLERNGAYRVQILASAQAEDKKVDDLYAELGLGGPTSRKQVWWRGYGRAAASYTILPFFEATATASYAGDHFDQRDRLRTDIVGPSARASESLAGELRLFGAVLGLRAEVRGSLRGEWSQTELESLQVARRVRDRQSLFSPVYRVATAVEPTKGVTLRGAVGSGQRIPSITELFGDGASLKANPTLVPESGRYIDAGVVFSGALGDVCATLEANGFLQRVDDKIVYRPTNQNQSAAQNFGHVELRGVELGADAAYRRALRLVSAATFMETEADHGLQLPRQPKLRLYARAESSMFPASTVDRVTFFATVDHVSTAYFDTANENLRTPYTHVGAGAALSFLNGRLEFSGRVSDLFDVRGQDFLYFPLPGRFFAFAVSIREEQR